LAFIDITQIEAFYVFNTSILFTLKVIFFLLLEWLAVFASMYLYAKKKKKHLYFGK